MTGSDPASHNNGCGMWLISL